jgi:hypothetical protein
MDFKGNEGRSAQCGDKSDLYRRGISFNVARIANSDFHDGEHPQDHGSLITGQIRCIIYNNPTHQGWVGGLTWREMKSSGV